MNAHACEIHQKICKNLNNRGAWNRYLKDTLTLSPNPTPNTNPKP